MKKNKEWSHAESEELDYREEPLLPDVFNKAQGEIREMCEKSHYKLCQCVSVTCISNLIFKHSLKKNDDSSTDGLVDKVLKIISRLMQNLKSFS